MRTRPESVGRTVRTQWIGTLLLMLLGICSPQLSRAAAITAKSAITFYGDAMVNSYDSSDTNKSTNGQYDPAKAGNHGDLTCNGGFWSFGGLRIFGSVSLYTHAAFPTVLLPFEYGLAPSAGAIVSVVGTTTNITASVINSLTPPPTPTTNQTIVSTTNVIYVQTTNYPYGATGVQTNRSANITGTNKTVVATGTNYVCGTTIYSANTLPTNVCSYTVQGHGGGPISYKYTLIVGTNYTDMTNFTYIFTTNYTYSYQQYAYSYTIYTTSPSYQTNWYDHVLCGDYYVTDSLSGSAAVTCPSRLVMPNGFQMSGGDQIVILPGGSLTIYSGGGSCNINTDAITNQSGLPAAFVLYGAPGMSNVVINGGQNFSGVIVAPDATTKINGSGSLPLNFYGALMVNSLTVNGILNFHYDEALNYRLSPPKPNGAVKSADGAFGFNVPGDSGLMFIVQASTNLVDWTYVTANVGPFYFSDPNANSLDQRFYRVVWP